jgi:hypothetical protein
MITHIGPKMYSATKDNENVGSTKIHKDVTDAWNVLTYASPADKGADWVLFSRKDTVRVVKWLQTKLDCEGDPVHHQQTFLTQADLADLWGELKIRPYLINQTLNQFVFIPAGCAHQVRLCEGCSVCQYQSHICSLSVYYHIPGEQPRGLYQSRM